MGWVIIGLFFLWFIVVNLPDYFLNTSPRWDNRYLYSHNPFPAIHGSDVHYGRWRLGS